MSIIGRLLDHAPVQAILIVGVVPYILYVIGMRIAEERRIQALGGHTRHATTYAPFGKINLIPGCPPLSTTSIYMAKYSLY